MINHYDGVYDYGRQASYVQNAKSADRQYEEALYAEIDELRAENATLKATIRMVTSVLTVAAENLRDI